jgi:hypothetical protein
MKLVTIKFKVPTGGSRKVNKFIQRTIDSVSDEVLMFDGEAQVKFPLYDGEFEVGEVEIQQAKD